jgi:ubiquinone/menaquinone biosynthesis C-methylase UbiE
VKHAHHVRLIERGVAGSGPAWADLGSGEGAFTFALADVLGPAARIWSVDIDAGCLRRQEQVMRERFPGADVTYLQGDFTRPLPLGPVDGILMANALHFARDRDAVVDLVGGYLHPGGRLVLVEYDADQGNPWVPYPLSFRTWLALPARAGFADTRLLAAVPSRFLGRIYSAVSVLPG